MVLFRLRWIGLGPRLLGDNPAVALRLTEADDWEKFASVPSSQQPIEPMSDSEGRGTTARDLLPARARVYLVYVSE